MTDDDLEVGMLVTIGMPWVRREESGYVHDEGGDIRPAAWAHDERPSSVPGTIVAVERWSDGFVVAIHIRDETKPERGHLIFMKGPCKTAVIRETPWLFACEVGKELQEPRRVQDVDGGYFAGTIFGDGNHARWAPRDRHDYDGATLIIGKREAST